MTGPMTAPPAETLPKEIEEALAAALDASWARSDETNRRVAALRAAIAAALRPQSEEAEKMAKALADIAAHWDDYADSEWGPEDRLGVRLLNRGRIALSEYREACTPPAAGENGGAR